MSNLGIAVFTLLGGALGGGGEAGVLKNKGKEIQSAWLFNFFSLIPGRVLVLRLLSDHESLLGRGLGCPLCGGLGGLGGRLGGGRRSRGPPHPARTGNMRAF